MVCAHPQYDLTYGRLVRKDATVSGGSKYITEPQATNIIEAVRFAKSVGRPLVAHLTIHWACTDIGDDPDGSLFSKFREGFSKWTRRRGFDFTGVWARERISSGQAEAVHCHLLFYLPPKYRSGSKLLQVETAIHRLIKRHGRLLNRPSCEARDPRQAALSRW
jgi:hypothetical protein